MSNSKLAVQITVNGLGNIVGLEKQQFLPVQIFGTASSLANAMLNLKTKGFEFSEESLAKLELLKTLKSVSDDDDSSKVTCISKLTGELSFTELWFGEHDNYNYVADNTFKYDFTIRVLVVPEKASIYVLKNYLRTIEESLKSYPAMLPARQRNLIRAYGYDNYLDAQTALFGYNAKPEEKLELDLSQFEENILKKLEELNILKQEIILFSEEVENNAKHF